MGGEPGELLQDARAGDGAALRKLLDLAWALDRRLRGTLYDGWKILPGEGRLPFLTGSVVLE